MNLLFDNSPIYDEVIESYIGYDINNNSLLKMDKDSLKKELVKTNEMIKNLQEELDDIGDHPSFVMKEELKNLEYYKDKIIDLLEKYKEDK